MIGIAVKTKNLDKVRKAIQRIEARLDRPSGFMGYVGAQGHKEIVSHFRNEKGPDGAWEPLQSRSGQALQLTGRLRASITWTKISDKAIKFMALVKYAIYHEKGTDNIPQRSFMWFPDGWLRKIARNYEKYVVGKPYS